MEEKKELKRLTIEVEDALHTEIKLRSVCKNISIRQWVIRALIEQIKKEKQYEQ